MSIFLRISTQDHPSFADRKQLLTADRNGIQRMSYLAVKHLHLTCVVLSLSLFALRGQRVLRRHAADLSHPFWRFAPHVVDSVLLVAGISLAVMADLNPLTQPWLATKLGLLLAYIGLGSVALKRGKTRTIRGVCLGLAGGCAAAMVLLAVQKPLLWG